MNKEEKDLLMLKFQNICSVLNTTMQELQEIQTDIFVLNPKISTLTEKIKKLEAEKEDIRRILNNE